MMLTVILSSEMRLHDAMMSILNPALQTREVHCNCLSAALGRRAAEVEQQCEKQSLADFCQRSP